MAEKDVLADAREAFEQACNAEDENRKAFIDDKRFARLGEQWPNAIIQERLREGRPCLTINRMPAFTRQVVNDARQNKPSIKIHPADSGADPETAKIYDGLIRNIEYTSNADIAYDTGIENAVDGGFGYWRVGIDYSCDDSFDLDLKIERVADPLLVYGDPYSTAADSSDWNTSFVCEYLSTDDFKKQYPKAEKVNWEDDYGSLGAPWWTDDTVMIAEWWKREKVKRDIVLMSDGTVLDEERLQDPELQQYLALAGVTPTKSRSAESWKVTQTIMSGAEVLKEQTDWPGRYIPIIPVYGDEVWIDGKRHLRSLIRDAKDPQRMFNYWRTTTTELVALAPKTPFIGKKGAFKTDAAKWATANTQSHAYIEHDGDQAPARQPFVGVPAGAMQEALNASDDMKAIMGIYDASLGARSNETSGVAIGARQREGDISTFHFIDNLGRSIRHTGRILLDLIPHVYSERRIVRVLGEDKKSTSVPLGQPVPVTDQNGQPKIDPQTQMPMTRIYDLTAGKYDLTVESGPSFTTRREETVAQMTGIIKAFPAAAPAIAGPLARNMDWPGADEIADRFEQLWQHMNPAAQQGQIPPQIQQAIQQGQQMIQQLTMENQQLKADKSIDMAKLDVDRDKLKVEAYKAETDRKHAEAEAVAGPPPPRQVSQAPRNYAQSPSSAPQQPEQNAHMQMQHDATMAKLADAIGMLAKAHSAPKRIIRGKDGRATHTETVLN
jgi:hypothetical protein